jgi:hypothetical protein
MTFFLVLLLPKLRGDRAQERWAPDRTSRPTRNQCCTIRSERSRPKASEYTQPRIAPFSQRRTSRILDRHRSATEPCRRSNQHADAGGQGHDKCTPHTGANRCLPERCSSRPGPHRAEQSQEQKQVDRHDHDQPGGRRSRSSRPPASETAVREGPIFRRARQAALIQARVVKSTDRT